MLFGSLADELSDTVLSRNPIRKMGNSLAKLKSIAKVSSLLNAN